MDMIDEIREEAHIREFSAKQRAARRYNSRVIPRSSCPNQNWKIIAKLEGTIPDKGEATTWSLQASGARWNPSTKNLECG